MTTGRKHSDAWTVAGNAGEGALSLHVVLGQDKAASAHDEELQLLITELFEQLCRPVHRYLRGQVRDAATARDLTQDVFVRLCTELAAGRRVDNARAWVFRVAHNLAVDEQRRTRVRDSHESSADADLLFVLSDPAPTVEHDVLRRERADWLRAALPRLSMQERRCLFLRAQGLRYREIAEVLEIKLPTVVTFLTRAVQKLMKARPEPVPGPVRGSRP